TPWGQNVTNWIIAAYGATGFLQANGAITFSFLKSASANAAAAGALRLANGDTVDWRNFGNTADDKLFPGLAASSQSADDLYYTNATTGVTTQLTGKPGAFYTASASVPFTIAGGVVTGFTTLVYDTDGAFNAGTSISLAIQINGSTTLQALDSLDATNGQTVIVSGIFNLAAGATIKIFQQSSVANAGAANAATNFVIIKGII